MVRKFSTIAVLCLTLTGCLGGESYWEKPGYNWTHEDFYRVYNRCKTRIDNDQSYGIGPIAQMVRNGAYKDCMKANGWRETDPPK